MLRMFTVHSTTSHVFAIYVCAVRLIRFFNSVRMAAVRSWLNLEAMTHGQQKHENIVRYIVEVKLANSKSKSSPKSSMSEC